MNFSWPKKTPFVISTMQRKAAELSLWPTWLQLSVCPLQDGRRPKDSQVGIWSMYKHVPRQASHSLQMSYNYRHSKLNTHWGKYETWNIDNTSSAQRRRFQFSFILLQSNWFREVTWGWKRGLKGGRGTDRGYVHLLVELPRSVLMISALRESLRGISQSNVNTSCLSVVCGVSYSSVFSILQSMSLGTHQRGS